jgi:hypothetical protein
LVERSSGPRRWATPESVASPRADVSGSQLDPSWWYLPQHSIAETAIHAGDELVHHGVEIGWLQKIYRSS